MFDPISLIVGSLLVGLSPLDQASRNAAAPDPDKRVCRRIMQTESRIPPPPVCKTQAEWDAEAREQKEGLDRARGRNQNPGNSRN